MFYVQQLVLADATIGVKIEWDASTADDLSYYEVEMSIGDNSHYVSLGTTTSTYFITDPLPNNTVVFVRVFAWDLYNNKSVTSAESTIRVKG